MNRLAVFDCDGTLVDSQGNIVAAMADAFRSQGLPPLPRAQILSIVGLSVVEAVAALLPEQGADVHLRISDAYKAAFHALRAQGAVREPLYDGIADAIDALSVDGWLLGVATGKSDRGLALCLAHHGLTDRFVTLQTADRHPSKPHPSMLLTAMADAGAAPATTVMIGDTGFDMAMARAAGVAGIGVDWGYHDVPALQAAGAARIARHADELAVLARAVLVPEPA